MNMDQGGSLVPSRVTGSEESKYCIGSFIPSPQSDESHRYVKPWADDKRMGRTKVGNWIVMGFLAVAFILSGYIMYTGAQEATIPAVSTGMIGDGHLQLT
jgi:hypothetical protein